MNRNAYPIAGAVIAAGLAGYLFGAANTGPADTPAPAAPVNIAVTYDDLNEISGVELTDANGEDVPVGSIAEGWPDDNTDAEEGDE